MTKWGLASIGSWVGRLTHSQKEPLCYWQNWQVPDSR